MQSVIASALIVLLYMVNGCGIRNESPPVGAVGSDVSSAALIDDLDSENGNLRVAATVELFRRGRAVRVALEQKGARPMATIRPQRRDVIISLIGGLDQTIEAPFRRDSFGLHVEPGVTAEEVIEMGQRHGFRVPAGWVMRPDAIPTVYVELATDAQLEDLLQAILSSEPSVLTVNLSYVERN